MLPPKVFRHDDVTVPDDEVARVQEKVNKLWLETPTVAAGCESYRLILQGIHDRYLPQPRPVGRSHKASFVIRNGKRCYIVDGSSWESVTDIMCPVCLVGMVRWHEAGYVPGWRRCDGCGRNYLATVQALGEAPAKTGTSFLRLEKL